jgi:hypothetical protein
MRPYTRAGGAVPAVFTSLDEDMHMSLKYPVASLFSLSNVVSFEPLVDDVLEVISEQLDKRFTQHAQIFDLSKWMQYFSFDVMGTLTFSKRYGFLEQGKDANGMLEAILQFMKVTAPVSPIHGCLYHVLGAELVSADDGNSLARQDLVQEQVGRYGATYSRK